jgi:uncharacterized membrane protein
MWNMLWPLLLVAGSNCFYHVCAKSTPEKVNAFGALTVTYLVGATVCAALFLASARPANALSALREINWTSFVLGLAVVGLEAGNVFLYRAGWKVSTGALCGYICSATGLLVIGLLFFHEAISARQALGMVACVAGLFLIAG